MEKVAAFYTLGCKVNQAETRRLAELLRLRGWSIVHHNDAAAVYVVNSCAVTAESARKTRQAVRRLKKNNPRALVALVGCMPSVAESLGESLPEAEIVLKQEEKDKLIPLLEGLAAQAQAFPDGSKGYSAPVERCPVKIQDGCDRFCSYCVIPHARGRARSLPFEDILDECRTLTEGGARELVLTGINLACYQHGGKGLAELAAEIASLPKLLRLRLGSLEPDLLTSSLLCSLAKTEKLCPQFHISLQSGSDSVLRRMNRRYDREGFIQLCTELRERFADCSLTTDIIVGFPGESERDFDYSLELVRQIRFEKVHVFPYSPRPGTPAAVMEGQIPKGEKERRARLLIEAAGQIRSEFLRKQIGKTVSILPEEESGGLVRGYTASYTPVRAAMPMPGEIKTVDVKITGVGEDFCLGVPA
ncbi:MAG: tRNA (N(6)-L-threonylcarbamoyladenosine(37)-C(2))-methylthiotransferase MtaB [Clostridium sp.]|nr:tRNA (N(6)-L-threonylcarbamoyladenosine(37)-C(2))-methylthiotransferase MtaB [Clostridium sp.]